MPRLAPDRLYGGRTGVFVGIGQTDLRRCAAWPRPRPTAIDAYVGSGIGLCFAGGPAVLRPGGCRGRALRWIPLCSSSLVAVHLACQALRAGESRRRPGRRRPTVLLAGGQHHFCRARMRPGRRRPLQGLRADADGYGRGEGCGMVVLKRLSRRWRTATGSGR